MGKAEKLPHAIKQQCLWIVRDYRRTRDEFDSLCQDIIRAGGSSATSYTAKNGEKMLVYLPKSRKAERTTESIALRVAALEDSPAFRQMRAVEHAEAKIGDDLTSTVSIQLRKAIWLNCLDGKRYTYERLYTVGMSRSEFYRRRDAFLADIARRIGLW